MVWGGSSISEDHSGLGRGPLISAVFLGRTEPHKNQLSLISRFIYVRASAHKSTSLLCCRRGLVKRSMPYGKRSMK